MDRVVILVLSKQLVRPGHSETPLGAPDTIEWIIWNS